MKLLQEINYEKIKVKGKLYLCNSSNGFNFPYTLFIPDDINDFTSLIVEGANAGKSANSIEEGINDVIDDVMSRRIITCNNETCFPILTPCFPRLYTEEDGGIFTHMLSSQSLNYNKYGLERIDIQLVNMINDAKKELFNLGITCDEKVIVDGFSASAKFVNRFALLHPEIVKLVIAGACSGTGIIPLRELNGEKLLYPIGCGNIDITDEQLEQFKQIKQFYYMGSLDPENNDPLGIKEDGKLISESSITMEEATQLYKYVGKKMIPDRWNTIQNIYSMLGVNAIFKTYEGVGHTPVPATEDIKELLLAEQKTKKL